MELVNKNHNRRNRNRGKVGDSLEDRYPHQLQFYTLPPTDDISLQEFEDFAIERLKVLKVVETTGIKHIRGSADWNTTLDKELSALKAQGIMKAMTITHKDETASQSTVENRRKDHISHFILRLAYCRTEELRRWFIAQEMDLFRYRFGRETQSNSYSFLKLNNLDFTPIPDSEKGHLSNELSACYHGTITGVDFYKVWFTEALDLVKSRKVYLKDGYAYVPHNDLVVLVLSVYRTKLSHALAVASRALPQLEEDERLLPMLSSLSKRYLGQDYNSKKPVGGHITADMIDGLSKKSFPMCMQQVHQGLRQHHHLKHWGRMQYGLFLKAIGLTLEEAMRFWRTEFTKVMDPDKFDKQYSYNIRHNYGKEGKRADYTPYSCIKIITSNNPGPGDHHGCPFKHTDQDLLKQRLQSQSCPKHVTDEIVNFCKGSHYQLACGRYFEWSHNEEAGNFNPNHPNQYFDESQMLLKGDRPSAGDVSASQTPRRVKIVPSQSSQKSSNQSTQNITQDDFDDLTMEEMDMAMQGVEEPSVITEEKS